MKCKRKKAKRKVLHLKLKRDNVVEETNINGMEDDIALITKRVQRLMMKDKFSGRTYNRRSNYKKKGSSRKEKEKR